MENSGQTPYRIIVVDDGSDDGCCDFLRAGQNRGITLITTAGIGTGRARNAGAAKVGADLLVFWNTWRTINMTTTGLCKNSTSLFK